MLWTSVSTYWKQEKRDLLIQNAKSIANAVQSKTVKQDDQIYIMDGQSMQTFITTYASNINAEIFITDVHGEKIFCSEGLICKHSDRSVPQSVIDKALEGMYERTSTLDNIYEDFHYIVGIPISTHQEYGGENIGVVFTCSDLKHLYYFRTDVLQIFLLTALIAFIISFCAMGILSYRMTLPLRQMSAAAMSFGKGDFSERIHVESKDEVGQLAESFNNMAESLSALEDMRKNFIANVSHELKTPMTTIAGFVDGILDHTIPEEKQAHYLGIVSSETKRLSRLVKSMLDLSRIDSNSLKLNIRSFNISEVVIRTFILFQEKIESKGVTVYGINNLENIFVDGDIDMIYQVVYNLIENAVKFVNENGWIKVHLISTKGKACVSIINSGKGISNNEISFVFDRFYKTDKSRSHDKNGMGLGLYIAKTIIALHKGEINASSIENEYTEFKFSIPMSEHTVKTIKYKN